MIDAPPASLPGGLASRSGKIRAMRTRLLPGRWVLLVSFLALGAYADQPRELVWRDLIPTPSVGDNPFALR